MDLLPILRCNLMKPFPYIESAVEDLDSGITGMHCFVSDVSRYVFYGTAYKLKR